MHSKQAMKYNKKLIFLSVYISSYILLRATHTMVHAGAYLENGILKYHAHRIDVTWGLGLISSEISSFINFIFYPIKFIEIIIWHIIQPISS